MPVTISPDTLSTEMGVDLATAQRLLAVASEIVTRYTPAAPDAILNQAVLMISGWLWGNAASRGGIKSESAGPLRVAYAVHEKNTLRHSGAMALLSPYKVRRAAAIG